MWKRSLLLALCAAATAAGNQDLAHVEDFVAAGKYTQALEALQRASPSTAQWHLLASKVFDGLKQPERAASEARTALELDPENEAHYLQLGQIFLTWNNPSAAHEIFSQALRRFPGSVLLKLGNGLALNQLRRYQDAEKAFTDCLAAQPSLGIALDGLVEALMRQARFNDAASLALTYLEQNRTDFRGFFYLAAAKHRLANDAAELEELLRRALELNPTYAPAHALLGRILLQAGRPEEAVLTLEGALRLRPDHLLAHLNLGRAYRKLGRNEDAEREFALVKELETEQSKSRPVLRMREGEDPLF